MITHRAIIEFIKFIIELLRAAFRRMHTAFIYASNNIPRFQFLEWAKSPINFLLSGKQWIFYMIKYILRGRISRPISAKPHEDLQMIPLSDSSVESSIDPSIDSSVDSSIDSSVDSSNNLSAKPAKKIFQTDFSRILDYEFCTKFNEYFGMDKRVASFSTPDKTPVRMSSPLRYKILVNMENGNQGVITVSDTFGRTFNGSEFEEFLYEFIRKSNTYSNIIGKKLICGIFVTPQKIEDNLHRIMKAEGNFIGINVKQFSPEDFPCKCNACKICRRREIAIYRSDPVIVTLERIAGEIDSVARRNV